MSEAAWINGLNDVDFKQTLKRCCHSESWASALMALRPFSSLEAFFSAAEKLWLSMSSDVWLEAFAAHPKIGDLKALEQRFSLSGDLSRQEQAAASLAATSVLQALHDENQAYEDKFGFIFIVCATGKTAEEMLGILRTRMAQERSEVLEISALEQWKITRLRLVKAMGKSPITTHILDTSQGKPAKSVWLKLSIEKDGGWEVLSEGQTDADGRVNTLLPSEYMARQGVYRLRFAVSDYFRHQSIASFYPFVDIVFEIWEDHAHYHVPLLLNPFGYSTYRGS